MHLLVFALAINYDPKKKGMSGGDRILIEVSKELRNRGHSVLIITGEAGALMLRDNGVDYFLPVSGTSGSLGILKRIIRGIRTGITIDLADVDAIYSSSIFLEDILPGWLAKIRDRNVKWIVGWWIFPPSPFAKENPYRGKMWLRGLAFYLIGKVSLFLVKRWADAVFVTNDLDKKKFERMGFPSDSVLVLKGGVNTNMCIPAQDPIYDAVFVGRLHPQKGVIQLIDIWERVTKRLPNAKLLIIGIGPLEDEVKKRIRMKGLDKNVEMAGFKDGIEKMILFSRSRVFLHPVIYDSGGMAPCEAMVCGIPCVAFDLPELRGYYPKGCLKVKPYDLDEFAEKIIKLLTDNVLYRQTANEAKEYCADWGWEKKAKEVENFLLTIKG